MLGGASGPAEALGLVAVALYAVVLALLLPFAGHRLTLLALSRRPPPVADPEQGHAGDRAARPRVTVQLPVFNERHVVERLIDAACRLSHPRTHLQIQVLDDSTDETTALATRRARAWRRRGVDVTVRHRAERTGYKAGALAAGLESATGEHVLILDADFVPAPDLLQRLLPSMSDPGVGMVQARWDHLNEGESWLTRAQAMLLDGHFFLEQRGRFRGGRFFNFNGTAGLWRRRAIEDAGGWQSDTLTEDLDISYRAQMAGWRFVLRDDVGVPAELPSSPASLLVQQRRWAQGGVQTARKVLPRLLAAPLGQALKLEAVVHLCGHLAHPLTFALSLLIVPSALGRRALGMDGLWWLDLALFLAATGPFIAFYAAAARRRARTAGRPTRTAERSTRTAKSSTRTAGSATRTAATTIRGIAGTLALGAGLSVLLSGAVLRGLWRRRDPFERTPKAGGAGRSSYEASGKGFRGRRLALGAGAYMVASGLVALAGGQWGSLPFVALFASGYLLTSSMSHTGSHIAARVQPGCSQTPVAS